MNLKELKTEISTHKDYKDLTDQQWDVKSTYRGLHKRSQVDFDWLEGMYPKKISALRDRLMGDWDFSGKMSDDGKTLNSPAEILDVVNAKMDEWSYCQQKEQRLLDKLACVIKEQMLRKDVAVVRTGTHDQANYYIDYDNGIDSAAGQSLPTGTAGTAVPTSYLTADGGTDATTLVDAALNGEAITDNAASSGDYVWNVTRSLGAHVDAWDDGTDTITLVGAGIAGQTTGDEYYILRPWKTITQYTTTAIRTAGDYGYMRANITWDQGTEAVNITFDEDGSIDSYIKLIGADSVTNDPWNDASDVKPIVDFETLNFNVTFSSDDYWNVERVDFINTEGSTGILRIDLSHYLYFLDVDVSGAGGASQEGVYLEGFSHHIVMENCEISDNEDINVGTRSTEPCELTMINCTIDGGAGGTVTGIDVTGKSEVYLDGCSIGPTNAHTGRDILVDVGGVLRMRNCDYNTLVIATDGRVYSEDDGGTFESQLTKFESGEISRGTTSPRAGGSDSFAILTPDSVCGLNNPLRLGDKFPGFARVWKAAGSYTATVYARVDSAWDSALTAAECYMVTSELDNAGTAARVKRQSTETITNDAAWTAFTTSISPAREGWVYFWFYLAEFEDASEAVDVDLKVTAA